jgi:hypothetical protein
MRTIRRSLTDGNGWIVVCLVGLLALAGCQDGRVSADERPLEAERDSEGKGFLTRVAEVFGREERVEVPAGTAVEVRLEHGVSSSSNRSGDRFTATLSEEISIDGKLLAPAGSRVEGMLPHVSGAERVRGRAEMSLTLTDITVEGRQYSLRTHPVAVQAEGTRGDDAKVIAGSAAAGAVIGALTGGRKGAVIGAGVGGGAGTGYVLVTKGDEVDFGPETRFSFTLSESLKLPVYPTSGSE